MEGSRDSETFEGAAATLVRAANGWLATVAVPFGLGFGVAAFVLRSGAFAFLAAVTLGYATLLLWGWRIAANPERGKDASTCLGVGLFGSVLALTPAFPELYPVYGVLGLFALGAALPWLSKRSLVSWSLGGAVVVIGGAVMSSSSWRLIEATSGVHVVLIAGLAATLPLPLIVFAGHVRSLRTSLARLASVNRELVAESERRQEAQEELVASVNRLERSNRDLEMFAHTASHDLQEPLRAVSSFTSILREGLQGRLDPAAEESMAFIEDGAQRMRQRVADLYAYSQLQVRQPEFREVDLEHLLQETLEQLRARIDEAGARVEHDELPQLVSDPSRLRVLLSNLLENALVHHATDAPPRIEVRASTGPETVVVRVSDNGGGFDARYAERVFRPFEQLDGDQDQKSSGIGLAICAKIVESLGGEIRCEPEEGRGTTVSFELPRGTEPSSG